MSFGFFSHLFCSPHVGSTSFPDLAPSHLLWTIIFAILHYYYCQRNPPLFELIFIVDSWVIKGLVRDLILVTEYVHF